MVEYAGQRFLFTAGPKLGSGGMADVYLGWVSSDPDHHVALKVPLPILDHEVKEAFLREAEAALKVSNPNVVRVEDWGESPPFIAFEYVEGKTLAEEINNRRMTKQYWSEDVLVGMYIQLVEAMRAINAEVIHRDLKPANIFFDDGLVKVSDFGISKYVGEVTRSATFKGWGTPTYMAPETFRNETVDWRCDQYSLGIVFYEMAAFEVPFAGAPDELEQLHLFERPPLVNSIVSTLPVRLASLIARMLEKRVEQRFDSWDDIASTLEDLTSPPENVQTDESSADRLAHSAARQIEALRSQELEVERQREESNSVRTIRLQLLEYWSKEYSDIVKLRVHELNQQLGTEAIKCQESQLLMKSGRESKNSYIVSFLDRRIECWLETVPVDEHDFVLWGGGLVKGPNRSALTNLLLLSDPLPYGTWLEAELRMNAIVRGGTKPSDNVRGNYEVLGRERLVLAKNLSALLHQRGEKNIMSTVDYKENSLTFSELLNVFMDVLIEG